MPRKPVSLPGASELFRPTASQPEPVADAPAKDVDLQASGRTAHREKITIYLSSEELMELEKARLELKGTHHISADRGRIVREAIAMALRDFSANADQSGLVAGLAQS